jgi:hypothetical protein
MWWNTINLFVQLLLIGYLSSATQMKRFAKHAKPLFTRLTQLKHNYTTPVEPLPESKINYWNPSSLIKRLSSLEPFAPQENLQVKFPLQDSDYIAYRIYRYDPTKDEAPYIQTWFMQKKDQQPMLLSNLFYLKDNEDECKFFLENINLYVNSISISKIL